ncbi:DNA gyrase [Olsenella sp. AM30-3LB]|uniref:DNA gyrase n=1 Tax=Olsenella sp. AM30-3LB TaxID=2292359 RepID=UPI000E47C8ED|nr:DNA gyrase [Olsenella sp. AM30-3LB]RHD71377.1 DNA gyrase [Olsenella sp. AM30-3LB]
MEGPEGKRRGRVWLSFHERFVRRAEYADRETGEERVLNTVTLPSGTVVDGTDYGGWQFHPRYVEPNHSKYHDEHWRDVPLPTGRAVRLSRDVLDADGNPMPDGEGGNQREFAEVDPARLRLTLVESRRRWYEQNGHDRTEARGDGTDGLSERAQGARAASEAIGRPGATNPQERSEKR